MKKILATLSIVGILILSGCNVFDLNISQAVRGCGIASDGYNNVVFSEVDRSDPESVANVVCVLYALDVPPKTLEQIRETTEADGVQTQKWEDVVATWSVENDRLTLVLK